MLTLPINKKWFDMIEQGIKRDEYRATTPYYITRFANLYEVSEQYLIDMIELNKSTHTTITIGRKSKLICLRNGYSLNSPSMVIKTILLIGEGIEEWGAEPSATYFCIRI